MLSSVGIEHQLHRDEGHWHLLVHEDRLIVARHQLNQYTLENQLKPEPPNQVVTFETGAIGVTGYLLIIWGAAFAEFAGVLNRTTGIMHAGAVVDGEWWRTITALTLHADLGHLISNSMFGALFVGLTCRYLGWGFGWLLTLSAGALGNTLNAWIQAEQFRSLGASTAVFAALGCVGMFVWQRGYLRKWGWRRSFAPLFAAIALVAYTGTGGGNTDVAAHLLGFASGAAAGWAVSRAPGYWFSSSVLQGAAAWVAGLTIVTAWMLAQ